MYVELKLGKILLELNKKRPDNYVQLALQLCNASLTNNIHHESNVQWHLLI